MDGADTRILNRRQIPSAEALRALNRRLRAWVASRDNVVLFPLAATVRTMKTVGHHIEIEGVRARLGPSAMLQSDRLHPRRLAMAVVANDIARLANRLLPVEHELRATPKLMDLIDQCRATDDLDEVLDRLEPGAHPGKNVGR